MKDTYIKVRVSKGKAALARRLPGGWFVIIATGTDHHIDTLWEELRRGSQTSAV